MRNRFSRFNRYVMNIETYRVILREINEDEELNSENVLLKVRSLERQKYVDEVEWEAREFTYIAQRKNIYHGSLLHAAATFGYVKAAQALIGAGADVEAKCFRGFTPLHSAAKYGQAGFAKLLLVHKANADAVDKRECTPLHLAAALGSPETVKALIEGGARVNAKDSMQNTPLHLAVNAVAKQRITETVRILLNHGADVDAIDQLGQTPLHRTIQKEDNAMVLEGQLTDHEIDGESQDRQIALLNKNKHTEEAVELLLEHGSALAARSYVGETPLHCAVKFSSEKVIKLLIKYGADVNAEDVVSDTPLHCVRFRHKISITESFKIAKILVESGSDIDSLELLVSEGWACISKVVIINHLLKNPSMNEPEFLERLDTDLSDYWYFISAAIKKERAKMCKTRVYKDITFCGILSSENLDELVSCVQNANVLKVLMAEEYKKDFPLHMDKIRQRYGIGIERLSLLNIAEESILKLFDSCTGRCGTLPILTAREIVSYLSNNDLRRLIRAVKGISVIRTSQGALNPPRLKIPRNQGQ